MLNFLVSSQFDLFNFNMNSYSINHVNEIIMLDGRSLPCIPAENGLPNHYVDLVGERALFYSNVNLFLEKAEMILSDDKMFLAPVYCLKNTFYRGTPPLGAIIEFWLKCRELAIETNALPIIEITGNPMTGTHRCKSVNSKGEIVNSELSIPFINLVKLYQSINVRYDTTKDTYQSFTLQEVIRRLNS